MMYESKMALAVKANGRVLREHKDIVYLPFGCEYSLLVKNLNSVRAIVKIWIDGTDVTEGTSGLIVQPNDSVDLERFIKNGNLHAGNKFKFIERTASVSNHRGNKIDDGLIRVEFEFEQERQPIKQPVWPTRWDRRLLGGPNDVYYGNVRGTAADVSVGDNYSLSDVTSTSLGSSNLEASYSATGGAASMDSMNVSKSASSSLRSRSFPPPQNAVQSEVGITVAGSESSQSFTWGSWFPTDGVKHTMVLRMLGEVEGQPVVKPVTVAHKPKCTTCGHVNRATAKFCTECGTALTIL